MTRVVIHAGFHKTGTSSAQAILRANAALLEPHLRVFLRDDFTPLIHAARSYSITRKEDGLTELRRQADRLFRRIDAADPRPVLISSEGLSGHLPGRRGLTCYDAAPRNMAALAEAARQRFGETLDLTFFFSTRDRDSWVRSTWWQNLRSTRLTEDIDLYAERIGKASDLPQIVATVAEVVAPVRVVAERLENSRERREGPLAPLLDLIDLPPEPRDSLEILPPENVQPDIGLGEVFLALNRSALKDPYLREAKKNLRRLANRQTGRD
ncbi:hypothetical protein [Salipiger abyssi]|uniref:hypothetical protein n=1 Tax=Salipiger abyssi TaxID=1250539 RepID=UPI0040582ACD